MTIRKKRVVLVIGGLLGGVLFTELILRALPVQFSERRLLRDGLLGWKNRPNWRGPKFSINSRGFIGQEFSPKKRPGTVRVFCLGDSCIAGDYLEDYAGSFPAQLASFLDRNFEVINAGVGGYSSFQGLLWFRTEIINYQPDIITVYFGWNDHWLARLGGSDRQLCGSTIERIRSTLSSVKLFQLTLKALQALRRKHNITHIEQRSSVVVPENVRVTLDEFDDNLREIISLAGSAGASVILMTAPNYLELALPEDSERIARTFGNLEVVKKLIELHSTYNEVVRQVARQEGVPLVDGDDIFRKAGSASELFNSPPGDFIHPSPIGFTLLARATSRLITRSLEEPPP